MEDTQRRLARHWQLADKQVRNFKHSCIVPGCGNAAIRSHAIQKASIESALAVGGHVYTLNPSFLSIMNSNPREEREIKKLSSGKAAVFVGFCPEHDTKLFFPIETLDHLKRANFNIALHVRALSLEFSRRRDVALFFQQLAKLEQNFSTADSIKESATNWQDQAERFYNKCLMPLLRRTLFDRFKKLDFLTIPIPVNLHVSCCGVFNSDASNYKSIVAYNVVSYQDMSFLSLTSRKQAYIDAFLKNYNGLKELERMINDVVFFKGEEPIISPRLWNTLSAGKRKKITQALVHPEYRKSQNSLDVIRLPKGKSVKFHDIEFYRRIGISDDISQQVVAALRNGSEVV